MRIIFVGIHNKPGMQPLDSKTNSGRKVDTAIKHIQEMWPGVEVLKSNYFNTEYLPAGYDCASRLNFREWAKRVDFNPWKDIPLTLGAIVYFEFIRGAPANNVDIGFWKITHPSFCSMDKFLTEVLTAIKPQVPKDGQ